MTTSYRRFQIELNEEHLEEASFLEEQCASLVDDPEVPWRERAEFEERLEAHIDALVLGGDLARDVCRRRAEEGDAGELFAAVCVFAREDRWDLLLEVFDSLPPDKPERAAAVARALERELPASWEERSVDLLRTRDELTPLVARVIGRRRIGASDALLERLEKGPVEARPAVARALGRLGDTRARGPLLHLRAAFGDVEFRYESLLALLRLGEPRALEIVREEAGLAPLGTKRASSEEEDPERAITLLGLAGGAEDVRNLLRISLATATPACLLALGLLGDPVAVPTILGHLPREETGDAAALALFAITGAMLAEEVFVPEEIDPDTLFEDEREKLERGEPPFAAGHPIPGDRVVRVSRDVEAWHRFWKENRARFRDGSRYELGEPASAKSTVALLTSDLSHPTLRRLAVEELVIRYGSRSDFEVELPVREAERRLVPLARWSVEVAARHEPGAFLFSGRAHPGVAAV